MSAKYYVVTKSPRVGWWSVVTPAGLVVADSPLEIEVNRIADLLNWYHETTVGMEWAKWHSARDVREQMKRALLEPPKPKPLTAPAPLVVPKPLSAPAPLALNKPAPLAL